MDMWLLCEHMVKQIWKKGGKWLLSIPLAIGLLSILWRAYYGRNPQKAAGFLPYQDMVDYSLAPWLFLVGLLGLIFLIFLHYRQYHTKSNGMITFFTLPLSTKQMVAGLVLPAIIWIFLYYAVWFVALILWYIPATELAAHVAMQQQFLADGQEMITGIDPHIHNGLYLAFMRSIFLSNVFFVEDTVFVGDGFLFQFVWLLGIAVVSVVASMIPRKEWIVIVMLAMVFTEKLTGIEGALWAFAVVWYLAIIIQMIRALYQYMKYPTA